MINERHLDELRFHAENALKLKDRSVEIDARTLNSLINEVEHYRIVNLLIEGKPLPPKSSQQFLLNTSS
jgi:hypothetical protein